MGTGEGSERISFQKKTLTHLLDDTQMHSAHTEHMKLILYAATQRKITISEICKNLKH